MNEKFSGDKLRLIRLFHGLSQDDLGNRVTSTRQYIQQLETGAKYPNKEFINVLSDALDVYTSFFFAHLENDVKEEQCHFRRRKTTTTTTIRQIISHATLFDSLLSILDRKLKLPKVNFPNIETKNFVEIENAAEECRKEWKLGLDTPIKSMTRVIENAGGTVTSFKNTSIKVDALSINRSRPIIFINNEHEISAARIRFDLAHECGHLVMHQGLETGDHKTEEEANYFAGAFLLPRRAFIQEFPRSTTDRIKWTEIYKMKLRWKTSVAAIIRRASNLQLISPIQYRRACIYLSKTGQTKQEQFDNSFEKESPELLKKAIDLLEKSFNINLNDMGKYLNLNANSISKLTGLETTHVKQENVFFFDKY